jgi:hypothetical protein
MSPEQRMLLLSLYSHQIRAALSQIQAHVNAQGSKSLSHLLKKHAAFLTHKASVEDLACLVQYIQGQFMMGKYDQNKFCFSQNSISLPPWILPDKQFEALDAEARNLPGFPVNSVSGYRYQQMQDMLTLMCKAPKFDGLLTVWRGFSPLEVPTVGDLVPHPGFMSTSLFKVFSTLWLGGGDCCLWQLTVDSHETPGVALMNSLSSLIFLGSEYEWLLGPCYLHVTQIETRPFLEHFSSEEIALLKSLSSSTLPETPLTVVYARVRAASQIRLEDGCVIIKPPTQSLPSSHSLLSRHHHDEHKQQKQQKERKQHEQRRHHYHHHQSAVSSEQPVILEVISEPVVTSAPEDQLIALESGSPLLLEEK